MKKSVQRNNKNYVEFLIHPDTIQEDVDRINNLARSLCLSKKGICIIPSSFYPMKIEVVSINNIKMKKKYLSEEELCQDGWINVYEFDTLKNAIDFSKYMSLLKPVCKIKYFGSRFSGTLKKK